ncbi:hypothetical protein B0H15DRAFT_829940 [Mycena belliarum]|uniref:Uncharacterized protein n=1 Tax=Mycena belliarum TaxID=1033014 RepID=A0AAD6UD28_9AGAR|nr:hypothetical protein B0H15DRAFT_829940 [Mycena belliae]
MEANAPPPPAEFEAVQIRDSLYWLTCVAHGLQGKNPTPDNSSLNPNIQEASSSNSSARALNHLAAILSRGRNDADEQEDARIVAVAAPSFSVKGIEVAIFATPPSNLSTLPNTSPSSSSSGAADAPPGNARNSTNEAEDGLFNGEVIVTPSSDDVLPWLDELLSKRPPTVAPNFHQYVKDSLQLLRVAGARIRESPVSASLLHNAVSLYFVASCSPKLKCRLNKFKLAYPSMALNGWTPHSNEVNAEEVVVTSPNIVVLLKAHHIPDGGKENTFVFDSTTAPVWWQVIQLVLMQLDLLFQENQIEFSMVAATSLLLHEIIHAVPVQLWMLQSFNDFINPAKIRKGPYHHFLTILSRDHVLSTFSPPAAPIEHGENEADEDDEPAEALLTDVRLNLPNTTPPRSRAFFRMTDALTAWTTGPRYLLRSSLTKTSVPIHLSVISLPRMPIATKRTEALVKHWADKGKWSSEASSVVLECLHKINGAGVQGACHCEAGLMASLFLRSSQYLPVGERQDHEDQDDPVFLAAALGSQRIIDNNVQIGVAKKCCPACSMLGDVLRENHSFVVELPGRHTRYYPWVPPQWLPACVLHAMEDRLLLVIEHMVKGQLLNSSRTSSPASDQDIDENNPLDPDLQSRLWSTKMRCM